MPLTRFAGYNRYPRQWLIPMPIALVQTNSLFYAPTKTGVVTAFLNLPESGSEKASEHSFAHPPSRLVSSTEAEWTSVFYGLTLAIQMDQSIIGLESNSLGIIRSILFNSPGKQDYARYYNYKIHRIGREVEWCGIRWIPRAENKASQLFSQLK